LSEQTSVEKPSHGPGFEFCIYFASPVSSVVLPHVLVLSSLIPKSTSGRSGVMA